MTAYSAYTDQELMASLKQGDRVAFTELFGRYNSLLLSFAAKKTGSLDDAEDAVQEVFIRLWNCREELEILGNARAYLHRAVVNQVLNQYKKERVKSEHVASFQVFLNTHTDTTDYKAREAILNEIIEREINSLPGKMAEVFRLRRDQQLSNREIAEQLGISEQTVETHIKRALKVLRSRLAIAIFLMQLFQ